MVEVTLREYCEEIEDLIDQGSYDAAISHIQHILKVHPKYLRAYSLMGKVALEKNDLEAAADLFGRLLSIDPEDFVARVGMGIAADKDGSLDEAVWQMERAFELAPDNRAVVSELRRLYGRRDGIEPEKIPLTPGALARLHARGSLYNQAISELRHLLAEEPDRVDLQVSLAETLWRVNRRIEAVDASLAVLQRLPYCLKANLILGEIWSSSGIEDEGAAHLNRARLIDPENDVAQLLFGSRSPLPPAEARIGRMEYVAPPAESEQEPDWLESIIEESAPLAEMDDAIPDWLQAVAASAELETPVPEETVGSDAPQHPDWLQAVVASADIEAEEATTAPALEIPDPTETEMPDWLAELSAETDATATAEPEMPPASGEDWLDTGAQIEAEPEELSAGEPERAASELPDWLAEMMPAETEPAEKKPTATETVATGLTGAGPSDDDILPSDEMEVDAGELPDWLREMASTNATLTKEEPELARADIPDWLAEMAPPELGPPVGASSAVADLDVAPAEIPDWLVEEATPEAEPSVAEPEAGGLQTEDTTEWLTDLVVAAGVSVEEDEAPGEQSTEPDDEELPDWLSGVVAESEPLAQEPVDLLDEAVDAATEDELMARLEDMSPEEAFAAWEAMLEEGEVEEEPAAEPETELTAAVLAAESIAVEEPDVYVQERKADPTVTEDAASEEELMARLEEMSPEEAFAAWEAMLAEAEVEVEAATVPETELAETPSPVVSVEIEGPEPEEQEISVYHDESPGIASTVEDDLMASLDEMSPEEAFAAWEAMLAESEDQLVDEEETPSVDELAKAEALWQTLADEPQIPEEVVLGERVAELEGEEEPSFEEAPPIGKVVEGDETWMMLVEDEALAADAPPASVPEAILEEVATEADEAWMTLVEDEDVEVVERPGVSEKELSVEPAVELEVEPEPAVEDLSLLESVTELEEAWMTLADDQDEAVTEDTKVELPTWATAEAALTEEEELMIGPEVVLLSEEEEIQVSTPKEPAAADELDLPEPEPPGKPTWVTLEEEPIGEGLPSVVDMPYLPEDAQETLQTARELWVAGNKAEAQASYERLLTTSLRKTVTGDLERIVEEEPPQEPVLRILGDSYIMDDRLEEALDAYRRALASL